MRLLRALPPTHPLAATLIGIRDRLRARPEVGPLEPSERADGKTALVVGASSGLGFASAVELARRGARVLMADCRDGARAAERATKLAQSPRVESLHVELSDLDSVAELCRSLGQRATTLDLVVLCAAIVPTEQRRTRQGLDEMFVVNYLSSFALLRGLLRAGVVRSRAFAPEAPEAPERTHRPRIVLVSSEAHRWPPDIDLDAVGRPEPSSVREVLTRYASYKLMLTTMAQELDRRLNAAGRADVGVFALCPGAMNTNIIREVPAPARALLRLGMRLFFQDPFHASRPVLYLACSRALEHESGVYLHGMTRKPVDPRAAAPELGRGLWERSEALLEARLEAHGPHAPAGARAAAAWEVA